MGENDLQTTHPHLAKEWNELKNGDLSPRDVTFGSHKKVWWICECGNEWEAVIAKRAQGQGCKCCAYRKNKRVKLHTSRYYAPTQKILHPLQNERVIAKRQPGIVLVFESFHIRPVRNGWFFFVLASNLQVCKRCKGNDHNFDHNADHN